MNKTCYLNQDAKTCPDRREHCKYCTGNLSLAKIVPHYASTLKPLTSILIQMLQGGFKKRIRDVKGDSLGAPHQLWNLKM